MAVKGQRYGSRAGKVRGTPAKARRVADAHRLAAKGMSREDIAKALGLSPLTIRDYLTRGTGKPQVSDVWRGELPELDDDEKQTLDEWLTSRHGSSMLSRAPEMCDPHSIKKRGEFDAKATRSMKKNGIPLQTGHEWAAGKDLIDRSAAKGER